LDILAHEGNGNCPARIFLWEQGMDQHDTKTPFASGAFDSRANVRHPPVLLAVDTDARNIGKLQTALSHDHQLEAVADGEALFDFCHRQLPDLIVFAEPRAAANGYASCRQLKEEPLTRYIPVIILADQPSPQEEVLALDAGAVDFIHLPVSAAVLRSRIQTHLMLRQKTKQILAFNATLERRIEETTSQLRATVETLHDFHSRLMDSEARATLSTVVANVSHELTTPITNSMLTANLLVDQTRELNDLVDSGQLRRSELGVFLHVLNEGTALMERNLVRANALIGSFKQVAVDQMSEEQREFDLAVTVREVVDSMMPGLKAKPHRIVMDIPVGIVMNSLPGRLGQVIINLINNAYLHAFDGRDGGELVIRAVREGEQVVLSFSDNGVGIPAENLERLFQPFFTTKKGRGGTGLGMPIVENLVRKSLEGSISVQSTPGVGTCFQMVLPLIRSNREWLN